MNKMQATIGICECLDSSNIQLLESMGCTVAKVPFDSDSCNTEALPTARIDAGCDDFEITLTLQAPFPALTMTYPMQEDVFAIDEAELEDWLGELANRLMGKLKGQLLSRSCTLSVGLPVYYFGEPPALVASDYDDGFLYETDGEVFTVKVAIEFMREDIAMTQASESTAPVIQDGELDFFF